MFSRTIYQQCKINSPFPVQLRPRHFETPSCYTRKWGFLTHRSSRRCLCHINRLFASDMPAMWNKLAVLTLFPLTASWAKSDNPGFNQTENHACSGFHLFLHLPMLSNLSKHFESETRKRLDILLYVHIKPLGKEKRR